MKSTTWKEQAAQPVDIVQLPYRARQAIEAYLEVSEASPAGRSALSEKERALAEREIWECLTKTQRSRYVRERMLQKILGVSPMRCRARAAMLRAGEAVDPLWKRVDHGTLERSERPLSLNQANNLLRCAKKKTASTGAPLAKTVCALLSAHDRRGSPASSKKSNGSPTAIRSGEARDFWAAHREMVQPYILSRLPADADELLSEQLYRDFEEAVKVAVEILATRISRQRTTSRDTHAVTERTQRARTKKALTLFGMDLPRKGKRLDRRMVKRRYIKVAAACHPDRHPSQQEVMGERFKEATRAYEDVLAWCDYRDGLSE